eukprot:2027993-Rhodomonas_salina.1
MPGTDLAYAATSADGFARLLDIRMGGRRAGEPRQCPRVAIGGTGAARSTEYSPVLAYHVWYNTVSGTDAPYAPTSRSEVAVRFRPLAVHVRASARGGGGGRLAANSRVSSLRSYAYLLAVPVRLIVPLPVLATVPAYAYLRQY